ncbi:MAG: hypothetical protein WDA27_10490 [Actinomycetota bacterium]
MERVVQKRVTSLRDDEREPRVTWLALVVALVLMGGTAGVSPTQAVWADTPVVSGNALSTATLLPPSAPSASAACDGPGRAKITVAWSQAAMSDGYDLYRSIVNGGPYSKVAHVAGGSTTSTVDRSLNTSTTYYYVLQATRNNWVSANSAQTQATTPGLCLA